MFQFLLTSALLAPLALDLAPAGWQGMKYLLQRDERYHGVTLTMSSDLTFWKQGAAYLRTIYDGGMLADGTEVAAQGIEGLAVLNVFEKDPNTFLQQVVYRGRVDFTQYRVSEKGVQVKLKELGTATNLLTRADLAVDLYGSDSLSGRALPAPRATQVLLHSQVLRLEYEATQKVESELSPGYMAGDEDSPSRHQLLYFGLDTPVRNDFGLGAVAGGFVAGGQEEAVAIYTAKGEEDIEVKFRLKASIEARNTAGPEFETFDADFLFRTDAGDLQNFAPSVHYEHQHGHTTQALDAEQTYSVHLSAGQGLYLFGRYYVHEVGGAATGLRYQATITATMQPGSYLRLTARATTAPTSCRGLLAHEALQRLAEAMADEPESFYSDYFGRPDAYPAGTYAKDGPGALRLLTNGFLLRGFPVPTDPYAVPDNGTDPRKPLTSTFSAVYNALDATECLGCATEHRHGRPILRVEDRAYFYQPKLALRLGAVQNLVKTPYLPLLHNAVEVGYQHWQGGAAVGLDEFNAKRTYAAPLTQIAATYSLISPANAAGYLIEQARRQPFTSGDNAEGAADNELFQISLRRAGLLEGFAPERDEAFSSVTGILDPPSTYNLRLSPGRNLRRHGAWLRGGLQVQASAGKLLRRGAVEGNDKLVSQLVTESQPVDEHAEVPLTDLTAPYVLAETYEFTTRLRRHELHKLLASPYGQVSFLDGQGQRKAGYLLQLECTPASGQASFTLLRAATPA